MSLSGFVSGKPCEKKLSGRLKSNPRIHGLSSEIATLLLPFLGSSCSGGGRKKKDILAPKTFMNPLDHLKLRYARSKIVYQVKLVL